MRNPIERKTQTGFITTTVPYGSIILIRKNLSGIKHTWEAYTGTLSKLFSD